MRHWLALCLPLCATALHAAPDFPGPDRAGGGRGQPDVPQAGPPTAQQLAVFGEAQRRPAGGGLHDTLAGDTIEEYGYQLDRHWGIGPKDKNNGVLLIIAQDERKVRIEGGYGLEGAPPDATPPTSSRPGSRPPSSAVTWWPVSPPAARASRQAPAGNISPVDNTSNADRAGRSRPFILVVIDR